MFPSIAAYVSKNFSRAISVSQVLSHLYGWELEPQKLRELVLELQQEYALVESTIDFNSLRGEPVYVQITHLNYLFVQVGLQYALYSHPLSHARALQLK